jgi:hypothetical protein
VTAPDCFSGPSWQLAASVGGSCATTRSYPAGSQESALRSPSRVLTEEPATASAGWRPRSWAVDGHKADVRVPKVTDPVSYLVMAATKRTL